MMWRRVDLVHSFLPLVLIATFWYVVHAQSATNGPSKCPAECIERQYARYWWTSMWGFVVTLVALTIDAWGAVKSENESTIENVAITLLVSALNPLFIAGYMLMNATYGMAMLANLREVFGDDVIAPLYPWSKSHIKIIVGCSIIVNLSPNVYNEIHNLNTFENEVLEKNPSEALVIGTKVRDSEQFNVQLSRNGELALLRSNVLPPYDELKILRGNSSLGMAIASAQAIGYIYGVVVRCVQGLGVSPIEAIACVLNMVILMKGVLHNFASWGHRPLFLYLLPEEEAKFIEECKTIQYFKFKTEVRFKLAISIASVVLLLVGAYFTINFLKSLDRACVIPIILFQVSLFLGGIFGFTWLSGPMHNLGIYMAFLVVLIVLLNLVGYVWAVVVTFRYCKGEGFDVQSSNYLSQVLPYIG